MTNDVTTCRELPIDFADCTWVEIDGLDRSRTVLILPVGSTEPHGPHLRHGLANPFG